GNALGKEGLKAI
nr:RecName: Full=Superoxide-inducible protein 5; Short=SOI5 [Bacillus subtilis]